MNKRQAQERIEAIRRSIQATDQINTLVSIGKEACSADRDTIPALRLRMDIAFGLLRKVLPDLKAVEHTGDVNSHITIEWNM
jgi:hypothetical protein